MSFTFKNTLLSPDRRAEAHRPLHPRLLRFPVDAVPASPSLAEQVGTTELRDDVDAATGLADAATARESVDATTEPVHASITHVTRVSGQDQCESGSDREMWETACISTRSAKRKDDSWSRQCERASRGRAAGAWWRVGAREQKDGANTSTR